MPLGRIQHIPNLPPEAARVLVERINALTDEVSALRRPPPVTGLKNDGHFATEGSVVRLRGGQRVAFPRARVENAGASIIVIVEVAGAISITAHRGFVNGARIQTLSDVGAYTFYSNGVDGWYLQGSLPGTSSGASALDAEYLVGAAHASLPSARVATDSAEIDADLTVANVASWALRTASVAFSKLANLTGLSVLGRAANSAGVMAAITATAARQTLRNNDAGTALEWGHPVEVRDSGADQGDAYALNFVAGTNCNIAATVAAGVATITPSVDLSSVTYTAGDGIDLAANQFSADVSDFAGTGLEDDGSNNLRIAAAAAGAGLTGGAGSALAVGAGTGITVNANDVAWNGVTVRSTSSGNVTRRAIRLIENSVYTWALVDDSGNDEVEVTLQLNAVPLASLVTLAGLSVLGRSANSSGTMAAITATAARQTLRANDAGTALEWSHPLEIRNNANTDLGDVFSIRGLNGTNTTVSVGAVSSGATTFAWNVDDYPLSGLADQAARSVVANATNASAAPTAVQSSAARQAFMSNSAGTALSWRTVELADLESIGNNRILVNVSGGSAPATANTIASLLGLGLLFNGTSQQIDVNPGEERHIYVDATASEIGFRKSRQRHFWFEDFDMGMAAGSLSATSGTNTLAPAASGNWLLGGVGGTATLEPQTPTDNHLGIWRLGSPATSGNSGLLHRGLNELRFDELWAVEAVLRVSTVTTVGFQFGLSDAASSGSNFIGFAVDTTAFGNLNIRARTAEATTLTTTDTGTALAAGAWNVYTIRQESAGTVDFYIDDVLEATHSTNVPDAETGGVNVMVYPRTNAARTIDVDYIGFESQSLGARTS